MTTRSARDILGHVFVPLRLTMYYAKTFLIVNPYRIKRRNFLGNIPNSHNIKTFSEYHSMSKPPQKLLEQVRNVFWLKHYYYKTEKSYLFS
jgi:hypothetical protein